MNNEKSRHQVRSASGASAGPVLPMPDLVAPPEITVGADAQLRGPQAIAFESIEVTQAIQNMNLSVSLIEGKSTVARVYVSVNLPYKVTLSGTAVARNPAGMGFPVTIPSIGKVAVNQGDTLNDRRNDVQKSLNFLLPRKLTKAGDCEIALAMLYVTVDFGFFKHTIPVPVAGAPKTKRTVTFLDSPPLRVHIVGIRYTKAGTTYTPSAQDYALIRSWLKRAYPIAEIVLSQVTTDAPPNFNNRASVINALLRGMRATDVAAGTDHRTHYYGLVADGGDFMRGLASGIPTSPDPSTVASGPTGSSTWGWDNDGSYGDWYTAHELGHTFGRFHAEFCGARGGRPYPFANGQLANADNEFVGFDVGDTALGLAMQALPGVEWHDVMSYCERQWLSSFTYEGVRDRLVDEDALPAPGAPGAGRMSISAAVHLVAVVNATAKTGSINHVAKLDVADAAAPDEGAASRFAVRVLAADDTVIGEYAAPFHPDACLDPDDDETGIVELALPPSPTAAKLELLMDGDVLDSFTRGAPAAAVQDIATDAAPAGRAVGSAGTSTNSTVISWTDVSGAAERKAPSSGSAVTFTVQLSTDGGTTWHAIGFGLTTPEIELDHSMLEDAESVMIRVTATDGFESETTTRTFDNTDL